jgi:hypothetical protein
VVGIDWQAEIRLGSIKYKLRPGTAPAPVLIDYKSLTAGERWIRDE